MSDRMERFYTFDGGDKAPPSQRWIGRFYSTTRDPKTGKTKPDWEPIVFHAPTEDEVRYRAQAFCEEQERKFTAHLERIAQRRAKREAQEASQ